jgi:hypothetical protein
MGRLSDKVRFPNTPCVLEVRLFDFKEKESGGHGCDCDSLDLDLGKIASKMTH